MILVKFINTKNRKRKVKTVPRNYQEVQELAVKLWGSEEAERCSIGYLDSDNEYINLVSDEEWEICLEEMRLCQEGKKIKTVTLKLIDSNIEDPKATENILDQRESMLRSFASGMDKISQIEPSDGQEDSEWGLVGPQDQGGFAFDSCKQEALVQTEVASERTGKQSKVEKEEKAVLEEEKEEETVFESREDILSTKAEAEQRDLNMVPESQVLSQMEPGMARKVSVTKLSNGDILIDAKIDGTPEELRRLQEELAHSATAFGMEIEESRIAPSQKEEEVLPGEDMVTEDYQAQDTPQRAPGNQEQDQFTGLTKQGVKKLIKNITKLKVKEEVSKVLKSLNISLADFKKLNQDSTHPNPAQPGSRCDTVHHNFTCDGCGMTPIVGVRYHSLHTRDFDLCERCERVLHHNHPMIRFRENSHRGFSGTRGWQTVQSVLKKHEKKLKRHCEKELKKAERCGKKLLDELMRAPLQVGNHKSCVKDVLRGLKKELKRGRDLQKRGRAEAGGAGSDGGDGGPQRRILRAGDRHPRLREFCDIFKRVGEGEMNRFLIEHQTIENDQELLNLAVEKYLESPKLK